MNNKSFKNIFSEKNMPFLFLLVVLIIFHWQIQLTNDDLFFSKQSLSFEFFRMRYLDWSSRLITEGILVGFLHLPVLFWKIFDIIIIYGFVRGINYLFWDEENSVTGNFLTVALCLLYPIQDMRSAGWVATINNYLWPMAFCLPSFIADKMIFYKRYLNRKLMAFSLIMLIVGTDVEFAWVFATLVTMGNFLLIKERKKYLSYFSIKFGILLLTFSKIILSPGNSTRFYSEVSSWFPDFLTLTIFDKIYLGVVLLLMLYLCFNILNKFSYKLLIVGLLMLKVFGMNAENQGNIWNFFGGGEQITIMNATKGANYLSFFLSLIVLVGIAVIFYALYGQTRKTACLLIWYLSGLAARMIMIFSPTLYASSSRTFLPLDVAFLGIAIILCKDIYYLKFQKLKKLSAI